jgi:hypothetical protein
MLNFDTIVSAFYHSGFMMVINWTQYPPEGYERLQCFEFDTGTLRKVPSPEIPGLEVYGTESVSAVCIYDKWICTAIGSYAEAKILVLDRKTKQLVATLLDPKLKSTKKQFKEYFCHSDIKMSGNAIAAVSERGQVAIWDTFTTNQAEPTRSWDAGFWADTVLFSESSQTTIISSKWHRRASAFKIGSGKVDQWERSSDNQRYRWISQDCGLKAEGYKVDNSGDYVPYIDISRIGEAKPFIGIKPVKRAMADIGEFYTAIIDWDCVTLVGSDGLIQLSFGEGNRPKREGCSGEIGTDVLINDFHPGREHMLFLQQKKRRPTKLARRDESSF